MAVSPTDHRLHHSNNEYFFFPEKFIKNTDYLTERHTDRISDEKCFCSRAYSAVPGAPSVV
jgi:hypothetical protein